MSEQNCTTASNGCVTCDSVPAKAPEPPRVLQHSVSGWDAGARSISELHETDVHTVFQVGQAAGVIIGFTRLPLLDPETDEVLRPGFSQTDPTTIEHGFYLWSQGGLLLGQVYESGAAAGPAFPRDANDEFEIRRHGAEVYYLINQELLRVSEVPSTGGLVVGCCLYMTGDTVL